MSKKNKKKARNWVDIDHRFSEKSSFWHEKTWQWLWKENNLTYQDAQEWVDYGSFFDLEDYSIIKSWKKLSFSFAQAQEWIEAGCGKSHYELANYLRINNHSPQTAFQDKSQAQHWLDWQYLKEREEITELKIIKQEIEGVLDFSDFINLENLDCSDNQLTHLILPTNNRLRKINFSDNFLTSFDYSKLDPKILIDLRVGNNLLESNNINIFSHLFNLTNLEIGNRKRPFKWTGTNKFFGSLESLKKITKLNYLDISNTGISQGLEELSESLNSFYCQGTKCEEELRKYGKPTDDNFIYLLKNYQKDYQNQRQIQFLEKQQFWFTEQEKEINYLENRISELVNLIKSQKQRIIEDFLDILSEKELIQELITNHLELKKGESKKLPTRKLKKECQRIEDELEDRLGEEFVEKLQPILNDCEKIVIWEVELEERLAQKALCIEKWNQNVKKINANQEKNWELQRIKEKNDRIETELAIISQRSHQQNIYNGKFSNFFDGIKEFQKTNSQSTKAQENIPLSFQKNSTESSILLTNKELGRGKFGKVYKGIWHGQNVAIKKIPAIYLKDIDKEIKTLKRLDHENIIRYHGEHAKGDSIYLIMELAENGSLNRWIEKNKNQEHNWQLNYQFIDQITKGLIYLHGENIIHRDLKSHNILISKDNIAKIADFGLAKIIDDSCASSGRKTKGTIRWMAPEVLKRGKHSFESDVYSLGMVMWEIVAKNTTPFSNFRDNASVMFNVGKDKENLKETIPNETPQELKGIIESCWQEDASLRINLIDIEEKLDKVIQAAVVEVVC
ncbi:MAG: Serine/threonine-protein kinase PknD [Mycoplasmataceae bacterium]|nr:Serine/threonine-protein kinase PknD [Mycoplasmataceae bacterium]WNE40080.1 MAG: Serine/threonine-protein kinase PknD [Mycoplasmataceae bacterium]